MIDKKIFKQRYSLPLVVKILMTQQRIREFYNANSGKVFLSFSGGKDSQVLGHIIRSMESPYCDIEFVFFDTNNERKDVFEIVERYGATVVKSERKIQDIFEEFGYPLFNKRIAHLIACFQKGYNLDVTEWRKKHASDSQQCVWQEFQLFINAPLKISDYCCDEIKKKVSTDFTKRTGKHPIVGTLAVDSPNRYRAYLAIGCNSFEQGNIKSTPMGFWSKRDVLDYIAQHELQIAKCYKAKIIYGLLPEFNKCELHGVKQTGCMTCGFGKGRLFAVKIIKAKCPEYYAEHESEFDAFVNYKNEKYTSTDSLGKIPPSNPWDWIKRKVG